MRSRGRHKPLCPRDVGPGTIPGLTETSVDPLQFKSKGRPTSPTAGFTRPRTLTFHDAGVECMSQSNRSVGVRIAS
jgi:hypothetical protein